MNAANTKIKVIRFLIYMIVGFLAAFLYRYLKNDQ